MEYGVLSWGINSRGVLIDRELGGLHALAREWHRGHLIYRACRALVISPDSTATPTSLSVALELRQPLLRLAC